MNPKQKAEELKNALTLQGALSLAESLVKGISGGKQNWGLADLPDYSKIANDVPVPEAMKKELYKRERNKEKKLII